MAEYTPVRELSYGAVEIYSEELLGVGSYGKVCKAKCGQLPCAAKLPHDTMFGTNDPGIRKYVEQFKQECQFLRAIKHPNIVQFLGTIVLQSGKHALLMELMDESLTRFLERSTGPLPYHTQLNICQDIALALAYLHSNDIIHRDLSSNNVLLIGEGIRAKVTDFGMSKLKGINPRMTPLTMCPGTLAYMPPEALVTPPRYSSKLDCFSHGVLTIQIATRQFPNPQDAKITEEDTRSPTGKIEIPVAETERRKKDINLVAPDHPLLSPALHCLKDRDTERPSADELCGKLATLKREPRYTHSVEQLKIQQQQIQEKDRELERIRANYEAELERHSSFQQLIHERNRSLQKQLREYQRLLYDKESGLERDRVEVKKNLVAMEVTITEPSKLSLPEQLRLTWKLRTPPPQNIRTSRGAAVVYGNSACFSQYYNLYSYTLHEDKWTTLPPCGCECFSLAVVNDKLTSIGGWKDGAATNTILCLSHGRKWKQLLPPMPTQRVRPAAVTTPTHLVVAGGRTEYIVGDALSTVEVLDLNTLQWSSASSSPEALKCPHMTLCCGGYLYLSTHNTIFSCSVEELLKSCKPPSTNKCSADDVYISCKYPSTRRRNSRSVWTRLPDIPVLYGASLATLRGHVLAIGGNNTAFVDNPTGAIHCYNRSTDSWSVIGEMPTPRSRTLVAVLPSNELIVVGGMEGRSEVNQTEIGHTN